MNRVRSALLLLTLGSVATACRDQQDHPMLAPTNPSTVASERNQDIPSRASESPRGSANLSDSQLWDLILRADNRALVGLKAPGRMRGVWRNQLLLSRSEWDQGRRAVQALPGITFVRDLPPLPIVELHIADTTALRQLRHLPFVDYVDPARYGSPASTAAATSRSATGLSPSFSTSDSDDISGCKRPKDYTQGFAGQTQFGDQLSYSFGPQYNRIQEAWAISQGDDVRIAMIDTGMDPVQTQFTDPARFNPRPWEYSRSIWIEDAIGTNSGADQCGHGTRMAGVVAAPNDGQSTAGHAWKADLISIRAGDNPTWYDPRYVYNAINIAMDAHWVHYGEPYPIYGSRSAHIINMAFKTDNSQVDIYYPYTIADLIRYYYAEPNGPVFIAAIGTLPVGVANAIFPAELPEVIAVVGINSDGSRNSESNYGPKSELAGYISQLSVSVPSLHAGQDFTAIWGASGASASVAGIAALVKARYPHMTNKQVRDRLQWATRHPHYHSWQDGYGPVNAYKAVGGFYDLRIDGRNCIGAYENRNVHLSAAPHGDGPFSYQWHDGQTAQTATFPAPPPGETEEYAVHVTDGLEGRTRVAYHYVERLPYDDTRITC